MMTEQDWNEAGKQLHDVWAQVVYDDIVAHGHKAHHSGWNELPELQQRAWVQVARVASQASAEMIYDLFTVHGDPTAPEQSYIPLIDIIKTATDHR